MRIIPAIDIINGKCVRLTKGNYSTSKTYYNDPLEIAKEFEANGVKYLHLVDLDGAKMRRIINYKTLERIASSTKLIIDFGGGLRSDEDIKTAFSSGAVQITGGSIAAKDSETFLRWLEQYGADKIILGADCINRMIATEGWSEGSSTDVLDFIKKYESEGIRSVVCTDISRDGTLEGPSTDLYEEIINNTDTRLIASGGIRGEDDILILEETGCEGAIIGKAIYEKRITLKQIQELCLRNE